MVSYYLGAGRVPIPMYNVQYYFLDTPYLRAPQRVAVAFFVGFLAVLSRGSIPYFSNRYKIIYKCTMIISKVRSSLGL